MKTYFLNEKKKRIQSDVAQYEQRIKRIAGLSKNLNIHLTDDVLMELTRSAPAVFQILLAKKQEELSNAYAIASLSKRSTKQLDEEAIEFDKLCDELRRLIIAKPILPASAWKGASVDKKALEAFIVTKCTVELTKQQQADVELIEAVAKVSPRFDPSDFVHDGRPMIEEYLECYS